MEHTCSLIHTHTHTETKWAKSLTAHELLILICASSSDHGEAHSELPHIFPSDTPLIES